LISIHLSWLRLLLRTNLLWHRLLLLLTTTEVTPFTVKELLKNWEQVKDKGVNTAILRHPARQGLHAQHQVIPHRDLRNDISTLGYISNT
jgi:hypothetical protein